MTDTSEQTAPDQDRPKLTKARRDFLWSCTLVEGTTCPDAYKPARYLYEKGLVSRKMELGGLQVIWWRYWITPAGILALMKGPRRPAWARPFAANVGTASD